VLLFIASFAYAEAFSDRVVAITDGDTISVVRNGRAEKVRLWGLTARSDARRSEHQLGNLL
jgi:hypothetical protein